MIKNTGSLGFQEGYKNAVTKLIPMSMVQGNGFLQGSVGGQLSQGQLVALLVLSRRMIGFREVEKPSFFSYLFYHFFFFFFCPLFLFIYFILFYFPFLYSQLIFQSLLIFFLPFSYSHFRAPQISSSSPFISLPFIINYYN